MTLIEIILSLVLALTGVGHSYDPSLQPLADLRAAQVTTNFSHDGMQGAEVLAWNSGFPTAEASAEAAVRGWYLSPGHRAIISDPSLPRAACATAAGASPDGSGAEARFWACVFAPAAGDEVLLPAPDSPYVPEPKEPAKPEKPAVPLLPNTATEAP